MGTFADRLFEAVQALELRERRRVPWAEVVRLADVRETSFYRWRDGESEPGFAETERLAVALGVRKEWLAWGEGPRDVSAAPGKLALPEDFPEPVRKPTTAKPKRHA